MRPAELPAAWDHSIPGRWEEPEMLAIAAGVVRERLDTAVEDSTAGIHRVYSS